MKKHSLLLAATVAVAALTLGGCAASSSTGTSDSELTVAVSLVPTKWDPATFDWGYQLQLEQAAYDTLIHAKPEGGFEAGLATEWSYPTPTQFAMTLREGVTFTDGTPFDADAVKANIEHAKSTSGPKTSQLAGIDSVDVLSDNQIVLNLSAPNPALPFTLSQAMGMMASPKAINDITSLEQQPVGAGPYTLDASRTVVNDHYTFVRNPDYWDAANVGYDTLVFRVFTDANALVNAMRTGEVDLGVGSAQTVDTAKSAGLTVLQYDGGLYSLLLQDRAGTIVPALGDVRVRQALNYAVDREAITSAVLPGRPTSQMYGTGTEAYDPELDDYYSYDPEKAKQLLADAGYADGFTLPVLSTSAFDAPLQAIASDLAKVGVTVEINNKSIADFIGARTTGEFPAYFGPNTPTNAYLDTQNWILPTGALNSFKVSDDTMNQLWAQGASEDDATRAETYKQLSKEVTAQAWFLVLEQASNYYYNSPDVDGVQPTAGQVVPFIYTWKPAAK